MTDITEKLLVALSAFVFICALGLQGLHSHKLPSTPDRADLTPDTLLDGSADLYSR